MTTPAAKAPPEGCQCPSRRNLVICIDGTANQFSTNNTNVIELYNRLVKSDEQLTYYNSGIGTYVKNSKSWLSLSAWKQSIHHTLDMWLAITFKDQVLSAYQWLSEIYKKGDRIFLFGFSRGAYQIRVIAGMIEKVGLLHRGNNQQIPFAYELYMKNTANEKRNSATPLDPLWKTFKEVFSRPDVNVHFVGAWDTVSSIGLFKGASLPETTTGMKHVCAFRHALALDELRVKFLPEYANGGAGPGDANHIKEVWFAGSHSDIGGGNHSNPGLNHFGPALRWMSYEAIRHGLKMKPQSQWSPVTPKPSMTWFYKIFEYFPISHLSYRDADSMVFRCHFNRPRHLQAGQLIHQSVFGEIEGDNQYKPKAHFNEENIEWLPEKLMERKMLEEDPYMQAEPILGRFKETKKVSGQDFDALYILANREDARQSITEFPDAAEILIATLCAEFERSNEDSSWKQRVITLVKVLTAFKPGLFRDLSNESIQNLSKLLPELEKEFPESCRSLTITFRGALSHFAGPYRIRAMSDKPGMYILEAGEAHGITKQAEFTVYFDTKVFPPVGNIVACEVTPFYTRCAVVGGSPFPLSQLAYAVQTHLRLFIEANDAFTPLIRLGNKVQHSVNDTNDFQSFRLLDKVCEDSELDLAITTRDSLVEFHVMDKRCREYGFTRMPFDNIRVEESEYLLSILRSAADFYRNLRHSNKSASLTQQITFECFKLVPNGKFTEDFDEILDQEGENLNQDGTIFIDVGDEACYGYKITNNSDVPLHAALLCFDVSDLTIVGYYLPGMAANGKVDFSLPAKGFLTIGFGDSGTPPAIYGLSENQSVDVSFLKLYLSTEFVDYSGIVQRSPFKNLRYSAIALESVPKQKHLWDTRTIRIIQQKGVASGQGSGSGVGSGGGFSGDFGSGFGVGFGAES